MAYKKLLAEQARDIALDGFEAYTLYINRFPFNCGLALDGAIYGDCWCIFPKVLIWSHACGIHPFQSRKDRTFFYNGTKGDYPEVGYAASYDGISKSGLGDWTGDVIMTNCTDVRSNFKRKEVAELMLIRGEHMAMYIGDFTIKGKLCNSVEFNYFNDELQGLLAFWTDEFGQRFWWKDGPSMGGRFDLIGKLSRWIDYTKQQDVVPQIKVDGIWGIKTTVLAQKVYGVKTDGIISHQLKSAYAYCPACLPKKVSGGTWEFDSTEGTDPLIVMIQKGADMDIKKSDKDYGKFKKPTIVAVQKKLGIKETGVFDKETCVAWQTWLNRKIKKQITAK